ncbi:PucR family transcriptional regulator [uncultured Clostridium sp.]|uniref:PucR family transcriptional regulator n=1 Tax=uncultured Clostridium sp. TaxID=59620 RepID=UPI0025E72700|nr:PucR family transcriptional regulator [uncultured Clostridium sp.]
MSITLQELYNESKDKYKLQIIAGENSIDTAVSWFHFMEDESAIDFIRGNELIVTTGLGAKDNHWLANLIKGLIARNACGLMINIGQYISKIPDEIISLCNDNNFPLFTIPWEVHLVDIMQDCCNSIMMAEQHKSNVCAAFFNAIFSPMQKASYIPCLNQAGYDLNGNFIVISIDLEQSLYEKSNNLKLKNLIMRIENILNPLSVKYSILQQNNEFNIIMNFTDNLSSAECVKSHLLSDFKNYSQIKHIGISSFSNSITNISKSYKQAADAKLTAIKNGSFLICYDDMGIEKLLLNVTDSEILKQIYEKYLGSIHAYDKLHNSDYENILKIYLKNNCCIQAVARETYTHRNTINYRIKKIKEILQTDLDNSEENFNYMLAFSIKETLDMESFNDTSMLNNL